VVRPPLPPAFEPAPTLAFIDVDSCEAGRPLFDIAVAARHWIPLRDRSTSTVSRPQHR